jgi:hypothetical protein
LEWVGKKICIPENVAIAMKFQEADCFAQLAI